MAKAKATVKAKAATPKKSAISSKLKSALGKKKTDKTAKATVARKPATRKKPIGFEMPKTNVSEIEKSFEALNGHFEQFGEALNDYVYEGKKKSAKITRQHLMDIIHEAKSLRFAIQEAKTKLKPIYKAA